MHRKIFTISLISLACASSVFAAEPLNLNHQPASVLKSFMPSKIATATMQQSSLKEISSDVDFNKTKHIRVQQTYAGYPVWGGDAVVHVPNGENATLFSLNSATTMNGMMFQGLESDLHRAPAYVTGAVQEDKAFQQAVQLHQKKSGVSQFDAKTAKKSLMVYIDKDKKAHWAYFITFASYAKDGTPAVPTYILDATNFAVYEEWDNIQALEKVQAGGFGGNGKTNRIVYDGLTGNFPVLNAKREGLTKTCTLENDAVQVKDHNHKNIWGDGEVAKFKCESQDKDHNNLYWSGDVDATNGAYSPANDALYIGQVIKEMYQKWYNLPALTFLKMFPLQLKLNVHVKDMLGQPMENAFFHPLFMQMFFGDGQKRFYPLTSLGVGAHEISHGFTSQHSNLTYEKQSGGLNEAFSDMAAQAAEFYSTGHNTWQIGPEIFKGEGALRYMDDPTRDGHSIGHVKDYNDGLNVHYTSGVFNKAFYLLGTAPGWDAHKAFDVMVQANMYYWTANTTFEEAACGVVKATNDYNNKGKNQYDMNAVKNAMNGVGIDVSHC